MINSNETVNPDFFKNASYNDKRINDAPTISPEICNNVGASDRLFTNGTVIDGFLVIGELKSGSQSEVYLAEKQGKYYAIKVYKNGWRPDKNLKDFLKTVKHRNIASVLEYGDINGNYYEIYEFFQCGTLEGKTFTVDYLSKVVIPSINEGLHQLHQNRLIHCDIKPENLFLSNEKDRIIIGDFSISGFAGSNGSMISEFRGTKKYAPPLRSVSGQYKYTPAYDYGSFGLVIKELADEIILPERIQTLVDGLTSDIDKRWSYNEVLQWCESNNNRKNASAVKPIDFGTFDDESVTVSSLSELAAAIRKHWEQAKTVMRRVELVDFLRQFIDEKEEIKDIIDFINNYKKNEAVYDADNAVFKLLLYLEKDLPTNGFCYCGKEYSDISDYFSELSKGDNIAKKFLFSKMLVVYLKEYNADEQLVSELEKTIDCNDDPQAVIKRICCAINDEHTISINGKQIGNMTELANAFAEMSLEEISELIETDAFSAWLYVIGFGDELNKMNEIGDD
ncbi:MAG: protein kinase family protein [Monoglobaceae bacterium]